jgi:hypothetical protein
MSGNDQMSDDDVLSAVSSSLSCIPMARPAQLGLEAVTARGRARQRRRRTSGLTAALAVVLAAGVATTMLLPVGHPSSSAGSSPSASARLAAWTVATRADGDIRITIRELRDPAGLQRTLRADGVPASVTFLGHPSAACRPLGFDPGLMAKIFPVTASGVRQHLHPGLNVGTRGPQEMLIDPSAIPSGVGVQMAWIRVGRDFLGRRDLVHASPQCTGS